MSESASAMLSIADANEFRFARFYIVCEAVMLGTLKSPRIVCRHALFRIYASAKRANESSAPFATRLQILTARLITSENYPSFVTTNSIRSSALIETSSTSAISLISRCTSLLSSSVSFFDNR